MRSTVFCIPYTIVFKAVPSVVVRLIDWKSSAIVVGVWVMLMSMASLVVPNVGAQVPVMSKISPVVKEVPVRVRAVAVVSEVVIVVAASIVRASEISSKSIQSVQFKVPVAPPSTKEKRVFVPSEIANVPPSSMVRVGEVELKSMSAPVPALVSSITAPVALA